MLHKTTGLHDFTVARDRRAQDAALRHRPTPVALPSAAPAPNARAREMRASRRERRGLARAELLVLAAIWLGGAAVILAAMVELVRSA